MPKRAPKPEPPSPSDHYDLFVIGSGPGGQRAAIQGAKLGKRVGLAEMQSSIGGVQINTGTIPSKTFREAVVQFASDRARQRASLRDLTMAELLRRVHSVVDVEENIARDQLLRNGVEVHWARASFTAPQRLRLEQPDGRGSQEIGADCVVIATGTSATRDDHIPFDGQRVLQLRRRAQPRAHPAHARRRRRRRHRL